MRGVGKKFIMKIRNKSNSFVHVAKRACTNHANGRLLISKITIARSNHSGSCRQRKRKASAEDTNSFYFSNRTEKRKDIRHASTSLIHRGGFRNRSCAQRESM